MMKKYSLIGLLVLLALYALFQARFLILGPSLSIETPKDNATVDQGPLLVSGVVKNTSVLSVNDSRLLTDTKGHFEDKLVAQRGINIIKLVAEDRFGRKREVFVRVFAN